LNSNEPKVAVVIVNWNRRELLLEALASCFLSNWTNLDVIVVDNGSSDGSVEAVREAFPETVLIVNEHNLGFARGSNQGFARAVSDGADYVLFLNNDATLDSNAIPAMVQLLGERPESGAVAPYIFYHDRRDVIWYGGGIVAFWRGRIAHRHIRRKFVLVEHQPAETDYLTGCVFMARIAALEPFKGFDTSLGLYSEDVDLSLKLRREGWRLWVTPEAQAYHRVSASAGGELSPFKAFHRGRSNALLVKRYAKWWEFPTLAVCGVLGLKFISLKLWLKGRPRTVLALWRGIVNGLFNGRIPAIYRLKTETNSDNA